MQEKLARYFLDKQKIKTLVNQETFSDHIARDSIVIYVLQGFVELGYCSSIEGRAEGVGAIVGKGAWVGLANYVCEDLAQITQVSSTANASIQVIDYATLDCVLNNNERSFNIFKTLASVLAKESVERCDDFENYSINTPFERHCSMLEVIKNQCQASTTTGIIKIPYSPEDMSRLTGNSREMSRRYTVRLIGEDKVYLDKQRHINILPGRLHERSILV